MKILIGRIASRQLQDTVYLMKKKLEEYHQDTSLGVSPGGNTGIAVEIWDGTGTQLTCADIKKSGADLFVNFDLDGFGQSTLTDGIAYNLLDCKQIHILLKNSSPEERYLAKQLSISMFFYCADSGYCRYLQDKYPDIPYLKAIGEWKREGEENCLSDNADTLCAIMHEVSKICHILP